MHTKSAAYRDFDSNLDYAADLYQKKLVLQEYVRPNLLQVQFIQNNYATIAIEENVSFIVLIQSVLSIHSKLKKFNVSSVKQNVMPKDADAPSNKN